MSLLYRKGTPSQRYPWKTAWMSRPCLVLWGTTQQDSPSAPTPMPQRRWNGMRQTPSGTSSAKQCEICQKISRNLYIRKTRKSRKNQHQAGEILPGAVSSFPLVSAYGSRFGSGEKRKNTTELFWWNIKKSSWFRKKSGTFWWRLLDSNQWPPACEGICRKQPQTYAPQLVAGFDFPYFATFFANGRPNPSEFTGRSHCLWHDSLVIQLYYIFSNSGNNYVN